MFKDALGEFGNRAAFCLLYVNQQVWDDIEMKQKEMTFEIPTNFEQNPDHYNSIVPQYLSEEVLKQNSKLLLEIESEQATKTANKIKEMYIRRYRYLEEMKQQKDLEHPLINFVFFLGSLKD